MQADRWHRTLARRNAPGLQVGQHAGQIVGQHESRLPDGRPVRNPFVGLECRHVDQGVGVIPWSPLARGRLTRDWDEATARSETDEFGKMLYFPDDKAIVDRVAEIAAERGVSRAQVALAWVLAKPFVTSPIVGATKPSHIDDAVAAVDLELTADEIARLEEPYTPHPVVGFR